MFVLRFHVKVDKNQEDGKIFQISAQPQIEMEGSGKMISPSLANLKLSVLRPSRSNALDPSIEIIPKSFNDIPLRFHPGNLVVLKVLLVTPLMSRLSYNVLLTSQNPEATS